MYSNCKVDYLLLNIIVVVSLMTKIFSRLGNDVGGKGCCYVASSAPLSLMITRFTMDQEFVVSERSKRPKW